MSDHLQYRYTTTPVPTTPPAIREYCPSGYYISSLPRSKDLVDTGWLMFTILVPAFFFGIGTMGCFANFAENRDMFSLMTRAQIYRAGFMAYVTFLSFCFCIALSITHTEREKMVEYYNSVVSDWNTQGGYQNMATCSDFRLFSTDSRYYSNTPLVQIKLDQTVLEPVVLRGKHTEGVDSATSVTRKATIAYNNGTGNFSLLGKMQYFGARLSHADPGGEGNDGQTLTTQFLNTSFAYSSTTLKFVSNYSESLYCDSEFCTSGCSLKYKSGKAFCSTLPNFNLQNYCAARKGVWKPTSTSSTSCYYYKMCGTCTYPRYLSKICFWVYRSSSSFYISTQYGECDYPYAKSYSSSLRGVAIDYVTLADVKEPPQSMEIVVRSVADPGMRLALLTEGTNTFGMSSYAKYRVPSFFMWTFFCFMFFATWGYMAFGEGWWFFGLPTRPGRNDGCCEDCLDGEDYSLDDGGFRSASERQNLLRANQGRPSNSRLYSAASLAQNIACQLCFENPRDRRFLPCKHHYACNDCTTRMISSQIACPLCRTRIESSEYCRPEDPTFAVFVETAPEENDDDDDGYNTANNNGDDSEASLNNNNNDDDSSNSRSGLIGPTTTASQQQQQDNLPQSGDSAVSSTGSTRSLICAICLDNPRNKRFRPCSHKVCCSECAPLFVNRPCPLCRANVTAVEACDPFAPTFVRF